MKYFPIFLHLEGRDVLVVGGGETAAQKVRLVARTPARITVVAPLFCNEILAMARGGRLELQRRAFRVADVEGMALVIGADERAAHNGEVAVAARARGVPVNIVDAPQHSTAIVPAIVDRDPVLIAIGTEGAAPIIARDLRMRIEAWLPSRFGRMVARAGALRPRVRDAIADSNLRRRFWERLLRGPFRRHAMADDAAVADRIVEMELRGAKTVAEPRGGVALIGCGPGDPDLLTLKALQHLQDADVLVYDRLVNPAILDYARRDAVRIDVGKTPGGRRTAQVEINRILVREAAKGNRVARLKGGDPMIFGRAAEELVAVRAAGIDVEIVPGITAAHAAAASIGLPLTLRGKVRHFSVVTGATEDGGAELDWRALSAPGQAFAIYMGVREAHRIQHKLLAAGGAGTTPVVIVENATRDSERAVSTTLADLGHVVDVERITGPAVIFIGLAWDAAQLPALPCIRDDRTVASRPERAPIGGRVGTLGRAA